MRILPVRALPAAAAAAVVLFAPIAGAQYATPPTFAPEPPREYAPPPEDPSPEHRQSDLAGVRLDFWHDGVSILGLRYMHMFEHGHVHLPESPALALGIGADLGAVNVSASDDRDKGGIADVVLRAAVGLPLGSLSGEVTSGVASGPGGAIQFASAGAFWGAYFMDVGYSYAFPLAPASRPAWLSAGMLSVRLLFPLDPDGWGGHRADRESARAR
jgi:hypothetical protein